MEDRIIISIISFLVALLGIFLNIVVVLVIPRLPRDYLAKSVKWLTWSKSTCNIFMCLFPTYIGIMAFFEIPFFQTYSHSIGTIAMIFYEYGILSSLLIALNRFCASICHLYYGTLFTTRSTLVMLTLISFISIAYSVSVYEVLGSQFIYNSTTFTFQFGASGVRFLPVQVTDMGLNLTLTAVSCALNCICIFRKRIRVERMVLPLSHIETANRMVTISVIQNATVIAGQLFHYVIAPLIGPSYPIPFYIVSNFWGFSHAIEAFVILISSKGMKNEIRKYFRSNRCQVVVRPARTDNRNDAAAQGPSIFQRVVNMPRRF